MRHVVNADAAHEVDHLFIVIHLQKSETRNVPTSNHSQKLCRVASNIIACNCKVISVVANKTGKTDVRFFKHDMKFSMEAN